MKIHQIWIGGTMPPEEREYVAGIKAAAEEAGHEHLLWDAASLAEVYGQEAPAAVFQKAVDFLPIGTVYGLMSDYYRLRVLAEEGGMYLDTDIRISGKWPEVAPEVDVWGMHESWNTEYMNSCLFMVRSAAPMRLAAELAGKHLLSQLPLNADHFEERLVAMIRGGGIVQNGVGPGWMRKVLLPAWEQAGYTYGMLPPDVAGCEQTSAHSCLTHMGAARWYKDRREKEGYWREQHKRARKLTAARKAAKRAAMLSAWAAALKKAIHKILPF